METKTDYYPGDYGRGDFLFPIDEWVNFQRQLATTDAVMRIIANRYKMKVLSNIRGEWPARRLTKRRGLKIFEMRILLNPEYLKNKKLFYELREHVMIDCWELWGKILKHRKVVEYSVDQLDDRILVMRDLENLICQSTGDSRNPVPKEHATSC